MVHYFEKNIVEIKNEYTEFLVDIITPLIYEGLNSIYKDSLKIEEKLIAKSKENPDIKPLNIWKLFQTCLREVPNYNKNIIDKETERIKNASKCYDWFDNLIKAVVKSHIILLTFTSPTKKCELIEQKYHENIDTCDFIHKCYIESAKAIYNNPQLFAHNLDPMEFKTNQNLIVSRIEKSIISAIRKLLPMKLILEEFLQNDYPDIDQMNCIPQSKIDNMKTMVHNDLTIPHNKPVYRPYDNNNHFEENNNDNEDDEDHDLDDNMDEIQDKISMLNDAIKNNLDIKKPKPDQEKKDLIHKTKSDSGSESAHQIINDSIKKVNNMFNLNQIKEPIVKKKKTKLTMHDILNTKGGNVVNALMNTNNKNKTVESADSQTDSSASRKSLSETVNDVKEETYNNPKEKNHLSNSEKTNFFANYLND